MIEMVIGALAGAGILTPVIAVLCVIVLLALISVLRFIKKLLSPFFFVARLGFRGVLRAILRSGTKAQKSPCIKYEELSRFLRGRQVAKAMQGNPSCRLIAERKVYKKHRKVFTRVRLSLYDEDRMQRINLRQPYYKVSERVDDALAAKFGPRLAIYV